MFQFTNYNTSNESTSLLNSLCGFLAFTHEMKRNISDDQASSPAKRHQKSGSNQQDVDNELQNGHGKRQILLNAFDMSTVGHLSPGQWKVERRSRELCNVQN
jgi:hypothetical protein